MDADEKAVVAKAAALMGTTRALLSDGPPGLPRGSTTQGLGQMLVACAVDRCLKAREQVAAYALIVDAKDNTGKRFYERFGFKALRDAGLTLYLPLGK
jgi:hypothetical protein